MNATPPSPQAERVTAAFRRRFGEPELLARGPGRLNLLGEHTDYNLGLVLPGAIDRAIWVAFRRRAGRQAEAVSLDLGGEAVFEMGGSTSSGAGWPLYLWGFLSELEAAGHHVLGFEMVFGGDLPIGGGLSSSAAMLAAFGLGLNSLFELGLSRLELARLAQRAEGRAGVACGLMDPFTSLHGRAGCLLHLDCRSLTYQEVCFPQKTVALVLSDSQVERRLAESAYNQRRAACEAGVAWLARHHQEVTSLRDVTAEMLAARQHEMPPEVAKRCSYVVSENERVNLAVAALERGDMTAVGELMRATHAGLRDEYDVSCPELDALAEGGDRLPGVYGSRMMGAGFGGSVLHLVEASALSEFEAGMEKVSRDRLGKPAKLIRCRLADGASVKWRAPT